MDAYEIVVHEVDRRRVGMILALRPRPQARFDRHINFAIGTIVAYSRHLDADIDRAIRRKQSFLKQPAVHSYEEVLT